MSENAVKDILDWFVAANQQPGTPTPDVRQTAFYIGMQMEELGEKTEQVVPMIGRWIKQVANQFKNGEFDHAVLAAMKDPAKAKEMLDGDIDLMWVSLGAARAMGSDVPGAIERVVERNYAKRFDDLRFHNDPVTNKVLKPEGWTAADLGEFLHTTLQPKAIPDAEEPAPPSDADMTLQVGSIVQPHDGTFFRSGSGNYTDAIVCSMDPFVLVSRPGDMLWSTTVSPHQVHVQGKATADEMEAPTARFTKWRAENNLDDL